MAIEKIQILGAVLELPAKQHCQFRPFGAIFELNGLDWHCCLAGSSKTAPRILIFSIAIGVDYSYEVKNSEIWAPTFYKHNNSFIAAVSILHLHGQSQIKISFDCITSNQQLQNSKKRWTSNNFLTNYNAIILQTLESKRKRLCLH